MKSFQWTLCAEYPDSSFAAATTTPGKMCFCSTYPLGSWVVWPSGVTEQTNTGFELHIDAMVYILSV